MYYKESDIIKNGNKIIKNVYTFNYSQTHSTYSIRLKAKTIITINDEGNLILFMTLSPDSKTIYYWIVDLNKDNASQPFPTPYVFLKISNLQVVSFAYKKVQDYIVLFYVEKTITMKFQLKLHMLKLKFNDASNPTSFTYSFHNIMEVDSFLVNTSVKEFIFGRNLINGYFTVLLNKYINTYYYNGSNIVQLKVFQSKAGQIVGDYHTLIAYQNTNLSVGDDYFAFVRFTSGKSGVILFNQNNSCLGFSRMSYPSNCYVDCPLFEAYDFTNKQCVSCTSPQQYVNNNECVTSCSSFSKVVGAYNVCESCPTNQYFNSVDNLCVTTCPEYLIPNTSTYVCENCKLLVPMQISYNGACIAGTSCPTNTLLGNSARNGCYDCKSINKYLEGGVCLDECSYGKILNHANNTCLSCANNEFNLNNQCVPVCGQGFIYDSFNVCKKCPSTLKLYNNEFVAKCPTNLGVDNFNQCVNCRDISQYMYKEKCYPTVPLNTELTNIFYNIYNDCAALNPKKFKYLNTCVEKCPQNYATYEDGDECLNWKDLDKYLFNNFILDHCPGFSFANSENVCQTCKDFDKFFHMGECLNKCPDYYFYDENNVCYNCDVSGKIYFGNKCVDSCAFYMYHDQNSNTCVFCKDTNQYMVFGEKRCVDRCPENLGIYDYYNVCSTNYCQDLNSYYFNYYCVIKCPKETSLDISTNICAYGFNNVVLGKLYS